MKVKVEVVLDLDLKRLISNMDLPLEERLKKSITKVIKANVGLLNVGKENLLDGVDIKKLLSSLKLHTL